MAEKPNILCLVSEDCPPLLGAYGDKVARSPHLDRLGRQGVVFETANCTSPVCAPSRFAILTGRHAESCPRAQHMQTVAHLPEEFDTYPDLMRRAGYYCTNNFKTHYNCDVDPNDIWDESSKTAHWRNRAEDQPFLAVFNIMTTHESRTQVEQPGEVLPQDVTVPSYLPDTPGMRLGLARHYNVIARMDAELGAYLDELAADGLCEDTIVFYYSDHGSALPRSKRYPYDEGLRVPLIVRVPEKWRHLLPHEPGTHVKTPVSLVDLFPSFLAVAGVPAPEGLQGWAFMGPGRRERTYAFGGRDRMGERYDLIRTVRSERYRYIRNYDPHRIPGQYVAYQWRGVAHQDYELAHLSGELNETQDRYWRRKPAEEFYDMRADPDATVNLIDDPAHAGALAAHRAALDAHMRAIHDTGFLPEHHPHETWEAVHDPEIYPLNAIMELAALAAKRDPADFPALMAALNHASPVMRYWAAKGLLMQAIEGNALPDGVRSAFAGEEDVQVRIPLAEALGHAGDARPWVGVLTDIVGTEVDPRVRLQAINALTWLPFHPDISLTALESLHDDADAGLRQSSDYLVQKMTGQYHPRNEIFRMDLFDFSAQTGTARPE